MQTQAIAIATVALTMLAPCARATPDPTFEGDTFTYQFTRFFTPTPQQTTVGPGIEFTLPAPDGLYEVDIDASSVTITARFNDPNSTDTWGSDGTTPLGSLQIAGLDLSEGNLILEATVSGTAQDLDDADITFTTNSVTIGQEQSGPNTITFSDGQFVRVELRDTCPGPNVTIIETGATFDTIAEAIAAVADGQTIELAPCVYTESRLNMIPLSNITVRGQGMDNSIIDPQGLAGPVFLASASPNLRLESLTIRNARTSNPSSPAAVIQAGESNTFVDCRFENNGQDGDLFPGIAIFDSAHFESCEFTGPNLTNSGPQVAVFNRSTAQFINCVFSGGSGEAFIAFRATGGLSVTASVSMINATFVNINAQHAAAISLVPPATDVSDASISVTNTIFDSPNPILVQNQSQLTIEDSLFPGAAAPNIDATPLFADAANNNFRPAPGSPAIDAANLDAYAQANGSLFDIASADRLVDDPQTTNTGSGPLQTLDIGAHEYQPPAPPTNPADLDNNGTIDVFDLIAFLQAFSAALN